MLHRRILKAASIICVTALAAAAIVYSTPPRNIAGLGDVASFNPEEMRFLDESGKSVSLADFKGKAVLVNFWATWCAPCRRELPVLAKLEAQYPGKLKILAVSVDVKGFETMNAFFAKFTTEHPDTYWDKNMAAFRMLHLQGLPITLVVDAKGEALGLVKGEIDWLGEAGRRVVEEAIGNGN